MTHRKAIAAYKTILTMRNKITGGTAFVLFGLKKKLQDVVDFQVEEEQKLIQKYDGKIGQNGMIDIPEDKREAFAEDFEKIGSVECDIDPVHVPADSIPGITLAEIEALDGFVIFD